MKPRMAITTSNRAERNFWSIFNIIFVISIIFAVCIGIWAITTYPNHNIQSQDVEYHGWFNPVNPLNPMNVPGSGFPGAIP